MALRTARSANLKLIRLLQAAEQPIYALDDERRIVFATAALGAWAGIEVAELMGQQCSYHSELESDGMATIAAALCPPPEAFAGQRLSGPLTSPATGSGSTRTAEFIPLADEHGECQGVLVLVAATDSSSEVLLPSSNSDESASLHERLRRFQQSWRQRFQLARLVGDSPAMKQVRAQVALAAAGTANVLLIGPQGSGRKHVARTIHALADTEGNSPLPVIACGDLTGEQLQAQFTTLSLRSNPTKAVGGAATTNVHAVLLTDVESLSAEAQATLAQMLFSAATSVRVFATSSRPLAECVAKNEFRYDLACLLATLSIVLPPLATRRADLPLLAQAFLEAQNAAGEKQLSGFTTEALESLAAYPWPGNVGELARFVAEAHATAEGPTVAPGDLPKRLYLAGEAAARPRKTPEAIDLTAFLAQVETELIRRALTQAKQNKSKAAKLLGLTRPRLYRRMVQLGLA